MRRGDVDWHSVKTQVIRIASTLTRFFFAIAWETCFSNFLWIPLGDHRDLSLWYGNFYIFNLSECRSSFKNISSISKRNYKLEPKPVNSLGSVPSFLSCSCMNLSYNQNSVLTRDEHKQIKLENMFYNLAGMEETKKCMWHIIKNSMWW